MSLASTQERDAYSVVTQIVQEKLGSCTLELFCAYHKATRKINPQTLRYVDDLRAYIPANFWKCYAKASINPDKHKVDPQKALESDVEFDYFAFLGLYESITPDPLGDTWDSHMSEFTKIQNEDRTSQDDDVRQAVPSAWLARACFVGDGKKQKAASLRFRRLRFRRKRMHRRLPRRI